ncbi:hypothetical protein AWN76_008730 [Rhodothermaceae bacterium RA]|nr:hypothetical protein AWN76_008730 [Rhodothermaceae bacterium RA]
MMRRWMGWMMGWLVVLPMGVQAQPATSEPVRGVDGVATRVEDTRRLVTLGGAITEIVYALGLGDRVVAADASSLYPPDVLEKPRLGYYRQASAEGILAQRPTLVVAPEGLGPPAVIEQLRAAVVPVLLLEEAHTVEAAVHRIRTLARALGRDATGEQIVARMEAELAAARPQQGAVPPRVLFIYARGAGLVNVAGRATAADAVIRLAGGENVVTAYEGYRPLTAEAAVAAAPEVIVVPQRGLESLGGVDGLLRQPGLALTPAGRQRRVVAVDDALLLSFGPRLGEGVLRLSRALRSERPAGEEGGRR